MKSLRNYNRLSRKYTVWLTRTVKTFKWFSEISKNFKKPFPSVVDAYCVTEKPSKQIWNEWKAQPGITSLLRTGQEIPINVFSTTNGYGSMTQSVRTYVSATRGNITQQFTRTLSEKNLELRRKRNPQRKPHDLRNLASTDKHSQQTRTDGLRNDTVTTSVRKIKDFEYTKLF